MSEITTASELDALPEESVVIHEYAHGVLCAQKRANGEWVTTAGVTETSESLSGLPVTVLYPDQPVTTQPTVQPSAEAVEGAFAEHQPTLRVDSGRGKVECGCGQWLDCEFIALGYVDLKSEASARAKHLVDAVLKLLPGRPESVVKAEALREHAQRVRRFMRPGLVNRATVLADLEDYAVRADRIEATS